MLDAWLKQGLSLHVYIYAQLLQMVIVMTIVITCALRKGERKDLTKASKIVSMPEVRKFELDLSEKQQEVDVDLDEQLDNIGKEGAVAKKETPEKHRRKSEECKEAEKEDSTQSSLKKQSISRKITQNHSDSRNTKDLQGKHNNNKVPFNFTSKGPFHFFDKLHEPNANVGIVGSSSRNASSVFTGYDAFPQ